MGSCGNVDKRGFVGVSFETTSSALTGTKHGPAGPISLKTVHWTVFRALDAPQGEGKGLGCQVTKSLPLEGKVARSAG